MRLNELLKKAGQAESKRDIEITVLTPDSREVKTGAAFFALSGAKQKGSDFIKEALHKGAGVIIWDGAEDMSQLAREYPEAIFIQAQEPRLLMSKLAAAFYDAQPSHIVAVTGTNGKTSVVNFVRQIWDELQINGASLGTIGVMSKTYTKDGTLTTPGAISLHQILKECSDHGITHLAMEASSHGLHQYRLHGVKVQVAAFTNLTRDHLDYHKTMEEYFKAKAILFNDVLQAGGVAVLNADSDHYDDLKKICAVRGIRVISFGEKGSDLKVEEMRPHAKGTSVRLNIKGEIENVEVPLVGLVQVANILTAAALVLGKDFDDKEKRAAVFATFKNLTTVRGRFEYVGMTPLGAAVYVDYAHTPDGLETLLKSLRPHVEKGSALHVVFGCGGDRDQGKRPLMGAAAADYADHVVVTDDNPRTENADEIRAAIVAKSPKAQNIGDRKRAIEVALQQAQKGDLVVIAGKGHEQGQIVGDKVIPFDDVSVAKNVIEEMRNQWQKNFGRKTP